MTLVSAPRCRRGAGVGVAAIAFCAGTLLRQPNAAAGEEGAEALFQRGVSDMQAGRYETACSALDESQRAEPRPGALFTAAECYAKWGKPAVALERYRAYLAAVPGLSPEQQLRHQARLELAQQAVDRLAAAAASQAPAVSQLPPDGVGLPPASPALLPASPAAAPAAAEATETGDARAVAALAAPTSVASEPASSAWKTLGWSLAGAGASGLVLGSVAGVVVWSAKGSVEAQCEAPDQTGRRPCSAAGYHALQRGQDWAAVANVSFSVGLAGLVTGAVLLLAPSSRGADPTAPPEIALAPWIDSQPNAVACGLKGSW